MPYHDVASKKEESKIHKVEEMKEHAGYTKHDHLFPKRQPVGSYIENLLTHRSQGVPDSHYKSLVSATHEDKIISRGRGGMTVLQGSPIGVTGHGGVKKGAKIPDVD